MERFICPLSTVELPLGIGVRQIGIRCPVRIGQADPLIFRQKHIMIVKIKITDLYAITDNLNRIVTIKCKKGHQTLNIYII